MLSLRSSGPNTAVASKLSWDGVRPHPQLQPSSAIWNSHRTNCCEKSSLLHKIKQNASSSLQFHGQPRETKKEFYFSPSVHHAPAMLSWGQFGRKIWNFLCCVVDSLSGAGSDIWLNCLWLLFLGSGRVPFAVHFMGMMSSLEMKLHWDTVPEMLQSRSPSSQRQWVWTQSLPSY